MTEIFLVRHGQTDWNIEGRLQGHSDIPLNAIGFAQAHKLAETITGEPFDAVYSSDLQRALQTARLIAERQDIPLDIDVRLREVNHGEWEGMLIRDILTEYGDVYAAFRNDQPGACPPGGESCSEAVARMSAALDSIASKFPFGRVIVVSHGLTQALLKCRLHKLPLGDSYHFKMDNCTGEWIHWDVQNLEA